MMKIHPSAIVHEGARLGVDVEIGPYSIVGPHVTLGDRVRIMPHVFLDGHTTLGAECTVFPFASLGSLTQDLKYKGGTTYVEIGERTTVREYVTINSGTADGEVTRVGSNCLIMAYCHVAHGSKVGNRVIMANCASLSGDGTVEDDATIGGMTGIHQFTRIGRFAMIGGMSRITQDVPPYMLVEGSPAEARGINSVKLQRMNISAEVQAALKKAYKILYRDGLSTRQAVERMRSELPPLPEVEYLLQFIESSERGIVK
jgi:UDP-N-acetylglucosamine acyltransferase